MSLLLLNRLFLGLFNVANFSHGRLWLLLLLLLVVEKALNGCLSLTNGLLLLLHHLLEIALTLSFLLLGHEVLAN